MAAMINDSNGFHPLAALKRAAADSRIAEIEGMGMDEGRVFIHLKRGWIFSPKGTHSVSVGNAADVRYALSCIIQCACTRCKAVGVFTPKGATMEQKLAQEKLDWLLKQLENAADTIDGPDGTPQPNTAMAILSAYEGFLEGWVK